MDLRDWRREILLPLLSGSNKKLNIYGLTMSFCCPSLPQSEPGGGAVSVVRVNIHYAIADVYFVYAGKAGDAHFLGALMAVAKSV